jgi:hypothetical protein
MTIDDLRKYQAYKNEIESLEQEKLSFYYPIQSPAANGSHSTTPGNPTERAVNQIARIDEMINRKKELLRDKVEEIEHWIDTVEDPEVRAVARWHYLIGLTWNETARHNTYAVSSGESCRKIIKRYFAEKK